MGKDTSSPPATDYQAQANADHVNQYSPFGSSTWTPAQAATPGTPGTAGHWQGSWADGHGGTTGGTWIPGTPGTPGTPATQATNTTTLDPRVQSALNSQFGQLAQNFSKPMDLSSVQDIYDQSYKQQTDRLDPQWAQNDQLQASTLANQGISAGGEAYDNAMRVYNNGKNDAYGQARQNAIATMPQTYQLAAQTYNNPLNEINAIRTGAQTQFNPLSSGTLQAAQLQNQSDLDKYNASVSSANSMNSGLFGLGAAGLLAFSDRRLKTDITKVGKTDEGLPVYTYRYKGENKMQMGIMAQDLEQVKPEAVHEIGGYKAVDYSQVE